MRLPEALLLTSDDSGFAQGVGTGQAQASGGA